MIISCPGRRAVLLWAFCLVLFIVSLQTNAQTPQSSPAGTPDPQAYSDTRHYPLQDSLEKKFFSNILATSVAFGRLPFVSIAATQNGEFR